VPVGSKAAAWSPEFCSDSSAQFWLRSYGTASSLWALGQLHGWNEERRDPDFDDPTPRSSLLGCRTAVVNRIRGRGREIK